MAGIFTILALGGFAQTSVRSTPLRIAYWGNFGLQPGIKAGIDLNLLEWESKKGGNKVRKIYLNPEIGAFFRRNVHSSFYVGTQIGYQGQPKDSKFYLTYSLGLGYLGESEVFSITYSLSDGSIESREREFRSYVLPTLNVSCGREINSRLGWYVRLSYGSKLSPDREASAMIFAEAGVKIDL